MYFLVFTKLIHNYNQLSFQTGSIILREHQWKVRFTISILKGGDDDLIEEDDESEDMSSSLNKDDTKVEVIEPSDIGQTDYCVVSATNVMELLYRLHGDTCKQPGCDQQLEFREMYRGTCLVVNWKCHAGHFGGRWASQPTCAGLRAGNLLLASAIALSGNSFTKIGFLFKT